MICSTLKYELSDNELLGTVAGRGDNKRCVRHKTSVWERISGGEVWLSESVVESGRECEWSRGPSAKLSVTRRR